MDNNTSIHTQIRLNEFVKDNKPFAYSIITLIFFLILIAGYLIFNERFSERAKQMAETNEKLSLAMKSNTESLSSMPKLVEAFSNIFTKFI